MKINKIKMIIKKIIISILAVILIITLPLISIRENDELKNIFSVFLGEQVKQQVILEVWNIDTFDSGTTPKSNYLSKVAKIFEQKNKGCLVMVKNLTEYECLNLLTKGYSPDIFSCSYGVASEIKNYIKPFSDISDIKMPEKLVNAGKIGNDAYGLPWCYGQYYLISSNNHLKNSGFFTKNNINESDNYKLSDYSLLLGYENAKKTKTTYSLSYGNNKYLLPIHALNSYNNRGLNFNSDFALNKKVTENTSYDAYIDFISNNCVMLLGTQRDVARINGRVENGKISDVIFEPITSFTDLIQFVFISNGDNITKINLAEKFSKMLLNEDSQKLLSSIGMFSVNQKIDYSNSVMIDITLDFNSIYTVFNVFTPKSELLTLQK